MNTKLLKSLMALHGDTNKSVAEALGIAENSFSAKLNDNGTEFKQREIASIKRRYNLTAEQIDAIFFAEEVS